MAQIHPYIPNTVPATRQAMLEAVGAASEEDFYADIPAELRVKGLLNLPAPFPAEAELVRHVHGLLDKNSRPLSFLGAGTYNHHIPAVVDEVIGRSEFLTAYAGEPYEDHGRFQALFEYTSLMAELLTMDVVSVPTYDGFQANGTALAMAQRITGRRRVLVVSDTGADLRSKVNDYVRPFVDLVDIPTADGVADLAAVARAISNDVAAIWVQTPSFTGAIETALTELAALAHNAGALLVVGTDPIMFGAVEPPAASGADIVCGDIQSLGVHQWFGGGHGGFLAVHDDPKFVLELPSRLFGLAATSVPGEYGFGDVAYERTSFAVREEGKEWVGTAAALWGIAAGVYLAVMGPKGMEELGRTVLDRTAYARKLIAETQGFALEDGAFHFREFTIDTSGTGRTAAEIVAAARAQGVEPGVVIGPHRLLTCVTELTTQQDIDHLVAVLRDAAEVQA